MVPRVTDGSSERNDQSDHLISDDRTPLLNGGDRQNDEQDNSTSIMLDGVSSSRGLFRWWKCLFGRVKSLWKGKGIDNRTRSSTNGDSTDEDSGVDDDSHSAWNMQYGTFEKDANEIKQQLATQFQELVASHAESDEHFYVLGDQLSLRLADAVIGESINEPCGLKGCRVLLYACCHGHKGTTEQSFLGNLYPATGLFATFEVILTLHARQTRSLARCWRTSARHYSNDFDIAKEKLYTCSSGRSSLQPSPGPPMS